MEVGYKTRILIADDEEAVCDVVKRYLGKHMGAEVAVVDSGEKAVQAVRDIKPDLMFLDVTLLGLLNGWQVVEEIRKFDQHVRIVMVSGYGSIPAQYEAMAKREIVEYLCKPIQIEKLYEVALKALGGVVNKPGDFFTASTSQEGMSADKIAHDLSNVQMTIQMHCAHFLSGVQDGYYKEALAERVLKEAAESFEAIQRKCVDLEKIVSAMRSSDSGGLDGN